MNELSLFSGAGGGLLGTKLLGWTTVSSVENNDYCQKVIAQRIKDGILDEAPIFGDVRAFTDEGYAGAYKGLVDVVTTGFPCQPFSVAGRRKGADDDRNMWPQTIECIRRIKPRYFFGENVPGLLNSGYFPEILGSLAEIGFDAKWIVLGADDVGAPHRRKRLWILAYPNTGHDSRAQEEVRARRHTADDGSEDVADPNNTGQQPSPRSGQSSREQTRNDPRWSSSDVADTNSIGFQERRGSEPVEKEYPTAERRGKGGHQGNWPTEPDVGRVANGVASRVDRLKAIGNGQVPLVAATAWELLSG